MQYNMHNRDWCCVYHQMTGKTRHHRDPIGAKFLTWNGNQFKNASHSRNKTLRDYSWHDSMAMKF